MSGEDFQEEAVLAAVKALKSSANYLESTDSGAPISAATAKSPLVAGVTAPMRLDLMAHATAESFAFLRYRVQATS